MAVHRTQVSEIDAQQSGFYKDVIKGLNASPKYLQSKYFYDKEGDKLFQQIMTLPEYYPTKAELEIFKKRTKTIVSTLSRLGNQFDIIELGAGDATKSKHLLKELLEKQVDFTYYPIDISENIIRNLEKKLPAQMEGLKVVGLNGDYFEMIGQAYKQSSRPKLILFLGSNIGNFTAEKAYQFLDKIRSLMAAGDLMLTGFDLKKNPHQILAAYNDKAGVTKAFNLNLLTRINNELDGSFDLTQFDHFATYNPVSGACKSYLISLKDQTVNIGNQSFDFEAYEPIFMEVSQKYAPEETDLMAAENGFKPVQYLYDSNRWFMDVVWEGV